MRYFKKVIPIILTIALVLLSTMASFADVYVKGYTKANGTYVEGYYRTAPNSTINDNYSTYPNINPYTDEKGTISPEYNSYSNYSINYGYIAQKTTNYKSHPNDNLTWTEIYNMQISLKSGGFYYGAIDGKFGPQTFNAVKLFQKSKWMATDGLVGPKTKAAIALINIKIDSSIAQNTAEYVGERLNSLCHGYGVCTWPNGDKYEGNWVNGQESGYGIYTWSSGDKYDGEWVNGAMHGHGIITWSNGSKWEGEWLNSQRTDQGAFTF